MGPSKLPVIFQTELSECGLACLAMISSYHGRKEDLNDLRRKFPLSLRGATLKSIIEAADHLGFSSRALRLELDDVENLILPAILHWKLDHFVVLKKVTRTSLVIHDPSYGLRHIPLKEASSLFTGVALELTPRIDFSKSKQNNNRLRISDLWSGISGLKRAAIMILGLSLLLQFFSLVLPLFLQLVVDDAIVKRDEELLVILALAFLGLLVIQFLTELFRSFVIIVYGNNASYQIISNIFHHLIRLPTSYYEKRHVGDVISRMKSTHPIQVALTENIISAFIDAMMAIVTLTIMMIYSVKLACVVLLTVMCMGLTMLTLYPQIRQRQEEVIINEAEEQTFTIETIRAARPIKLFSQESQRENVWRNLYLRVMNSKIRHEKARITHSSLQSLLQGLQIVAIVYLGAKLILNPEVTFTVGMLFAFLAFRQSFTSSVQTLLAKGIEFRLLKLHLDRLADIVKTDKEEIIEKADNRPISGGLTLRNVSFRYSPFDPWILKDFSMNIEAAKFYAIQGPSGCGKSTLMKLMIGILSNEDGDILIDGLPMKSLSVRSYRSQIGVVMQGDILLKGTIGQNITFFDPDIDNERVYLAAKKANIHEEIMAMPMQYSSLAGDTGSNLSGGQQQRILLARALYRDPKILFLDEGTANLDAKNAGTIAETLRGLNITRIVIAHSDHLPSLADHVINLAENIKG